MKKILFVMPSLDSGGAEKSLVNLLNIIDYKKYDIDLLLLKQEGLFLDQIPKEVNLYLLQTHYNMLIRSIKVCLIHFQV